MGVFVKSGCAGDRAFGSQVLYPSSVQTARVVPPQQLDSVVQPHSSRQWHSGEQVQFVQWQCLMVRSPLSLSCKSRARRFGRLAKLSLLKPV